jgi:hypothetical protein
MCYLDAVCPGFVVLSTLVGDEEAAKRAGSNEEAKTALIAELESMDLDSDAEFINRFAQIQLMPGRGGNKYILGFESIFKEFLAHRVAEH